jgi:hypothetical protein
MRRGFAALVFGVLGAGCAGLLSIDDVGYEGAADGGTGDGPAADGGSVTDAPVEADAAGEAGPSFTYSDLQDPAAWSTVLLGTFGANPGGQWRNAVFDGRYVHFGPLSFGGQLLSYDTTATSFTRAASWTAIVVPLPDGGTPAFFSGVAQAAGKVFVVSAGHLTDPDLLYYRNAGDLPAAGFQALDLTPLAPDTAWGYAGLDGRYLYLTPSTRRNSSTDPSGVVLRLDPAALPGAAPAVFDVAQGVSLDAQGFRDAVFDGRFLYFMPNLNTKGLSGVFARYDTQGAFVDPRAWDWFDLAALDPALTRFGCGTFDGRYAYFFTAPTIGRTYTKVARYDTQGLFASTNAWTQLDLTDGSGAAIGDVGGASFDGRYVYVLANGGAPDASRYLVRIDSTVPLAAPAVQMAAFPGVLKLTAPPTQLKFSGLTFDGQYVYLGPAIGGVVARFLARTPGAPLTRGGGSVF